MPTTIILNYNTKKLPPQNETMMKLTKYRIKEECPGGTSTRCFLQFLDCYRLFYIIPTTFKRWRYIPDNFTINIFSKNTCPSIITASATNFYHTFSNEVVRSNLRDNQVKLYLFAKENPFIEMYLNRLLQEKKENKKDKIKYL